MYNVQIKIGEILKDLILKYTKGESSSVTVEKLDIIKILSNKIDTNYEWEELYIEYLKSLSENKLKEIENLINGKL